MTQSLDEFHRLRTAYLRLRAALRDPSSGLFHYSLHTDEIRALLADRHRIGVIWVTLGERRMIESVYGWEAYDALVQVAARALLEARGALLAENTLIVATGVHADAFALFVRDDLQPGGLDQGRLVALAEAVETLVEQAVDAFSQGSMSGTGTARAGAAFLVDNPLRRFERLIAGALEEARSRAERPRDVERLAWYAELQRLLREREVQALFQPLIELRSGKQLGVEAFCRGPEGSVFKLPRVLFSVAREAGLVLDLDRLCRRTVFAALEPRQPTELLFLNCSAEALADPDWASEEISRAIERAGLQRSQVVLEVGEAGLAGELDSWAELFAWLRRLGHRISLDDAGSSQSTSRVVDKLRPEFIKFDLSPIRGLSQDPLRRELVRSLVRLAERSGAQLIAEAVEQDAEREALLECGATWGQGYLFGAETLARRTPLAPGDRP